MPGYLRPDGAGQSLSAVFFSDDHGQTWRFGENSTVGPGTSESDVAPLQHTPGRLVFNHRRDGSSGTRWQSFSDDDGLSWHSFGPAPLLPDPGCKGGIAAWPARRALLFVNDATRSGRVNVTLRVSTDDGQSWPVTKLISGPGGYTDVQLATSKDGVDHACVVFEYGGCEIRVSCIPGDHLLGP